MTKFIFINMYLILSATSAFSGVFDGTWQARLSNEFNNKIELIWIIDGQKLTTESTCYFSDENDMKVNATSVIEANEVKIGITQPSYKIIYRNNHSCSAGFKNQTFFKVLKIATDSFSIDSWALNGESEIIEFVRVR